MIINSLFAVIMLLHESDVLSDNHSDNRSDFLSARKTSTDNRTDHLRDLFARLSSMQRAITNAQRLVDLYLLIQTSPPQVRRVCCNARNVSESLGSSGRRLLHTKMYTLVTWCKKWHAPVARWNQHACTLHSRPSTFGSGVGGRDFSSSSKSQNLCENISDDLWAEEDAHKIAEIFCVIMWAIIL